MRIGVISDTHIPVVCDEIPETVKKHFQGVDMILHAGDLIALDVIDMLKEICPNVHAVCGNMDSHNGPGQLPEREIITAGKFKIGLTHGWGAPDGIVERIAREFKDVDVIVFGHTHKPINILKNGVLFFNPGSATDTIYATENTIGILECNDSIQAKIIQI